MLDTLRVAHANVDSNAGSASKIPLFLLDDTSHEANCTDVKEFSDDYDTLLTHSFHSVSTRHDQ